MSFTIDCSECERQHTPTCDDCVVNFICGREPGDALVIDVAEERAVRLLGRAGLVPALRHRRRQSGVAVVAHDCSGGSRAASW